MIMREWSKSYCELRPPKRLLLGGGPSNIDSRVLKALTLPIVGHLDPYFSEIMNETVELLRYAFKTNNRITLPISGTGTAGMEAAICNIVERDDEVVACINGFFGERISDIVQRNGGKCITVKGEWGKVISKEDVKEALSNSAAEVVAIVHAETSTGVLQPLKEIKKIVDEYDALLLVDAVTSLGGCELDVDGLGIDVCYSASQKCLNCPPGLAPITVSEKAMEKIRNRKTKVQSWYLDLSLIEKYWLESNRVYHHTAPILLVYALREALRLLYEEGLEARWERHRRNSLALISGIAALGLEMHPKEYRCPVLNAVSIPEGIQDINVRRTLVNEFDITVSGGLGALKGKVWRIGLMGINSTKRNVILFLKALERALKKEGYPVKLGEGVSSAMNKFADQ
jgi:alanine-glyoxylate transaminase/serine-glyoxylate transaminase/serine-pyruvate transaminase